MIKEAIPKRVTANISGCECIRPNFVAVAADAHKTENNKPAKNQLTPLFPFEIMRESTS